MQPWQQNQQAAQQAAQQAQQFARQQQQVAQQAAQQFARQQQAMYQAWRLQNAPSARPKSAAAGCVRTLLWIVALAVVLYVVYLLLIAHHLGV